MTDGTVGLTPVTTQHHTVLDLVLVLLEHLEERVDTRTLLLPLVRRESMPQPVFLLLCQVHVRLENGEVIQGCMPAEPVLPFFHLLSVPTNHTTVIDRESRVGDDQLFVDADDSSEALTLWTGPYG